MNRKKRNIQLNPDGWQRWGGGSTVLLHDLEEFDDDFA